MLYLQYLLCVFIDKAADGAVLMSGQVEGEVDEGSLVHGQPGPHNKNPSRHALEI